ncbi:sulfate permease [Microbacterium sp. NPDC056234]|uniref:sulfate permease n=1 Tax=Microbacterium sp. NPDC056234 TaxID=3345757 RepID=UPI0035D71ED2
MLTFAMRLSIFIVGLRRFLPVNILLAWLHTRRGLKYGVPAMLLCIPYWLLARWLLDQVQTGVFIEGFYVVALASGWSALKLGFHGPWSLILLTKVRASEAVARRHRRRAQPPTIPPRPTASMQVASLSVPE